jgi:hypothetical protein
LKKLRKREINESSSLAAMNAMIRFLLNLDLQFLSVALLRSQR